MAAEKINKVEHVLSGWFKVQTITLRFKLTKMIRYRLGLLP